MKTSSKYLHVFIGIISILILAGCAAKSDVEALEQQARHDRLQQRALYKELEADLSKKIETTSSPVQARQADIWSELSTLKQELAIISGRMDDIDLKMTELAGTENATMGLPQMSDEIAAIKFALEHQLAVDLDEAMKAVAAAKPAPTRLTGEAESAENQGIVLIQEVHNEDGTTSTVQIVSPATEESEQAVEAVENAADPAQMLYDKAYQSFGAREYDKARSLWAEFTTTFTGNTLVPNAIFWQGECWYQLQDYQRAILAYQDVIKKFPKSTKYKYALLKQGISFYRLDKKDLGKLVLSDLVSKHPKSTEAARAKQYIKDN